MSRTALLAAVLLAAALFSGHASGQMAPSPDSMAPTASPGSECLTNLLNMSDCLSYVQEGSGAPSKPDKACCPELAGLVESSPQCLCYLLGGDTAEQYGIKIDMAKALKLPSLCRVQTPSPSLCSLFGVPVAAPSMNEESSSPPASSISPVSQSGQPLEGPAAGPVMGTPANKASRAAGSAVEFIGGLAILTIATFIF